MMTVREAILQNEFPGHLATAVVDGIRGRIFCKKGTIGPGALTVFEVTEMLEDCLRDRSGLKLLRIGLSAPTAVFVTHRTIGAPDVIQVFLKMEVDGRPSRVFACIVMSMDRVKMDLETENWIVEGLDLQISQSELTPQNVKMAILAWCARIFAYVPSKVVIEPHGDDQDRRRLDADDIVFPELGPENAGQVVAEIVFRDDGTDGFDVENAEQNWEHRIRADPPDTVDGNFMFWNPWMPLPLFVTPQEQKQGPLVSQKIVDSIEPTTQELLARIRDLERVVLILATLRSDGLVNDPAIDAIFKRCEKEQPPEPIEWPMAKKDEAT